MANRKSAQRSRIRKLQNISVLERNVDNVQDDLHKLSPQLDHLRRRYKEVLTKNQQLKAFLCRLLQDMQPQQPLQQHWHMHGLNASVASTLLPELPLNAGLLAAQQALAQAHSLAAAQSMAAQQALLNAASRSMALHAAPQPEAGQSDTAPGQLVHDAIGALLHPLSAVHLQALAQTLAGGAHPVAQTLAHASSLQTQPTQGIHTQDSTDGTEPSQLAFADFSMNTNPDTSVPLVQPLAQDPQHSLQQTIQMLSSMDSTQQGVQQQQLLRALLVSQAAGGSMSPDMLHHIAASSSAPPLPEGSQWSVQSLHRSAASTQNTNLVPVLSDEGTLIKLETINPTTADNNSSDTASGQLDVLGPGTTSMCQSPSSSMQLPKVKTEEEEPSLSGLSHCEEHSLLSTRHLQHGLDHMDTMEGILSGIFEMVPDDLDDWNALCPEDALPELKPVRDCDSFMAACHFAPYDQDGSMML